MSQKDRLMLSGLLVVILIAGYWFAVLSPKRESAAQAKEQVTTAHQALETAKQQLTNGQQAQKRFRKDRTTVVRLGRVVPTTDDSATVLTQLSSLARKHKVNFTSYAISADGAAGAAPAPTESAAAPGTGNEAPKSTDAVAPLYPPGSVTMTGGLGRTPLKINLTGTYFNIERYLRAVQRFAVVSAEGKDTKADGRLFIVDGVNYKRAEFEDLDVTTDILAVELFASVYFAPAIETPSADAVPGAPAPGTPGTTTTTSGTAAIGGLR